MASRLTAFALGLLLLFTGCTSSAPTIDDPSSPSPTPTASTTPPEQRAQQRLAEALDQLAAEGGLRSTGSLQIDRVAWDDLDLRVTSSGVAYGAMTHREQRLRVLALDSETALVRASPTFWESALSGAGGQEKAKRYANHWVRVDPQVVSHVGDVLRPRVVAAQFRRSLDEGGVRSVRSGTVGDEAVDVIAVGNSIFHVTKAEPARLLKVRFPELTAPDQATDPESSDGITGSSGHAGNAGVALLGHVQGHGTREHSTREHSTREHDNRAHDEEGNGDDEDGLGTDAMDLPDIADLYDELSTVASGKGLGEALDARVEFHLDSDIQLLCPPVNSGACRVTAAVSTTVSGVPGKVQGEVTALLEATVTGPLNTATCRDSRAMRPNGRAQMGCPVNLLLPPCRRRGGCTWPVTGTATVLATARLDLERIRELLDKKEQQDVAKLRSKPAPAERLANDLRSWQTRRFQVGRDTCTLTKERMTHILERYHHRYWSGGPTTTRQDFFRGNPSIKQVERIIAEAIRQNRDKLVGLGLRNSGPLYATVDGRKYKFVIDGGRIVQFTPIS